MIPSSSSFPFSSVSTLEEDKREDCASRPRNEFAPPRHSTLAESSLRGGAGQVLDMVRKIRDSSILHKFPLCIAPIDTPFSSDVHDDTDEGQRPRSERSDERVPSSSRTPHPFDCQIDPLI